MAQPPQRRDQPAPPHPKPKKQAALRRRGEEALRQNLWRLLGEDLTVVDGISVGTALSFATEVGPDLSAFPDEHHFVSWLRLSPHTPTSGNKPLRGKKAPTGSTHLANAFRMAALTLKHSLSALGADYRRLAFRHGASVAVFAMARKLAILCFRMLRYGRPYVDIGIEAYEAQFKHRRLLHLQNRARELGYHLLPVEAAG